MERLAKRPARISRPAALQLDAVRVGQPFDRDFPFDSHHLIRSRASHICWTTPRASVKRTTSSGVGNKPQPRRNRNLDATVMHLTTAKLKVRGVRARACLQNEATEMAIWLIQAQHAGWWLIPNNGVAIGTIQPQRPGPLRANLGGEKLQFATKQRRRLGVSKSAVAGSTVPAPAKGAGAE